ncbi:MAG: hypothetical protein SF123_09060 [Chloroflexota bacterium]|nr:hypothetical protein [Chloroflexota bacterium]
MADAYVFLALVDTLIPGDELFPPASAVGTQHWLLDKLRQQDNGEGIDRLLRVLGDDFAQNTAGERASLVSRLEQDEPLLFATVRQLVYFGYYQSPLVVRAVRQLGIVYNDAPQPEGYDLGVFDPNINLPIQPRGHFVPTDEVKRVDLSALNLNLKVNHDDEA